MLNQEQSDYIKSLKITHPNVDENTLRQLLGGAGWNESEINEALSIYNDTYQAGQFVTPQPDNREVQVENKEQKTEDPARQASNNLDEQAKFKENIVEPTTTSRTTPLPTEDIEKKYEDNDGVVDGGALAGSDDAKEGIATDPVATPKNRVENFSDDTSDVPQLDSEFKGVKGPDFSKDVDIEVNDENINDTPNTSTKKPLNLLIIVLLGIALLGCLAGIGYVAYQQVVGGSAVQLNNNNILSTTLGKIAEIKLANYKVEFGMSVNEREANARSVDQVFTVSEEEREALNRDKKRVDDVSEILSDIRGYAYRADIVSGYEESQNFPLTLDMLSVSSTDPLGQPYSYELIEGGEEFNLTIEFETDSAVNSLKERDFLGTLMIDGKKVTFQQNSFVSSRSFDGKPEYPKIIEAFAEGAVGLEPVIASDAEIVFAVDGGFDRSVKNSADLRFGIGGEATFGDMMFALEAEFRKKAEDYYFIARKFPAFFGNFNSYKNKWIHFTQTDVEEEMGISLVDLEEVVGELNGGGGDSVSGEYQAQFEEIIRTADKHSVFTIESADKVTVEDRELTEYKLRLSRDNIVAFYEDISEKLATYDHPLIERDEEVMKELKKEDSALAFDFVNENITFSLFYDKKGFPVRYQIDIRYVPTEEAVSVKDKQLNLVMNNTFTDINKRNKVEAPDEYIELKDVLEEMKQYNNNIFLQDATVFKYVTGVIE